MVPPQNNMRELWALLHFLHPDKFPSSAAFEAEYNMQDPEQVGLRAGVEAGRRCAV
jgi:SNF2 family DNA or RNA helicase